MFVKSQNQNAFIQYSHITGEKINANVYCVENDEMNIVDVKELITQK